MGKIRHFGLVQ